MLKNVIFSTILLTLITTYISGNTFQSPPDSGYLPQITITSLNGFGPYTIGTQRTNYFMAYDFPDNTSKVMFRFIDMDGNQINDSYTEEGDNLRDAFWEVESDTMNFPLNPKLHVQLTYQSDSVANYYIPYLVYPDTIYFTATQGWGPFITNNYTRTDTSFHNVSQLKNTFTVKNLPPKTDTVKFRIFKADSTVFDSAMVVAASGYYLDSARYLNVRMDLLPLSTRYVEARIFCYGGPSGGMIQQKTLAIYPQKPKLTCKTDLITLHDSIPVQNQNQIAGQAVMIDTNKYAQIQNGPGIMHQAVTGERYAGPYSFDIMRGTFSIEAWLQFNNNLSGLPPGIMELMTVDSLWQITINKDGAAYNLYFFSLAGGDQSQLVSASLPGIANGSWHHVAYTFSYQQSSGNHSVKVYWDGIRISSSLVDVDEDMFDYVYQNIPYQNNMKTNPLILGGQQDEMPSLAVVTALDEVRMWNNERSATDIRNNYKKPVLQDNALVGYWNFDDLRNRLKLVSDDSYINNTGSLENGAYYIPQDKIIQNLQDTLFFKSSNLHTDSIRFTFTDNHNVVLYTNLLKTGHNGTLSYDLSSLPYTVSKLTTSEYFQSCPDSGYMTSYNLTIYPPIPIATPTYNWSTFYQSDQASDHITNTIKVSGLPTGSYQMVCGLVKDNVVYDEATYDENTVPYRYSLTLNGTDNYIETGKNIQCPTDGDISFWFKTSSTAGGKLLSFSTSQNGVGSTRNEREFILEKNGSIRFNVMSGYVLYAEHAYNDGEWHQAEILFGSMSANLYMDGSLVCHLLIPYLQSYSGYWVIGRNHANDDSEYRSLAEFYGGSLAEFYIWNPYSKTETLYQLSDGTGTVVTDSKGSNHGSLKGGIQRWFKTGNQLSYITWQGNMINKPAGTYTFFAKVFYNGGPSAGVFYPLGNFIIREPLPGCTFNYNYEQGIGYFNEGVQLTNLIDMYTNYTLQGSAGWAADFVQAVFMTPDHEVIRQETHAYTSPALFSFSFDMGDAPPGSYMSFQIGYISTSHDTNVQRSFPVPIYINQIIEPTVTGDFGPFTQAIAPGTMQQNNTFTISTDHLDDMTKITGKFYNQGGTLIAQTNAVKINDTTWNLTYNMATLSPPETMLKIEYYLGTFPDPALIEGPYTITVHKTRPRWFDFLADSDFHDVQESGDVVTFRLATYLSEENRSRVARTFKIHKGVPFFEESEFKTETGTVEAYLKYTKSQSKLELNEPPVFQENTVQPSIGPAEIVTLQFQYNQNNSYYLDENNDLVATQNNADAIDLVWSIKRIVDNPFTKFIELYRMVKAPKWQVSNFIGPTANFTISPTVGYASRLHYTVDTTNGKWGSFGTLKIDSNPHHEEAFKNSSSFHFVFIGMDSEISVGVTFGSGLVDVYAGLAAGIYVGMGESYINIPKSDDHFIMSGLIELYFRVYLTALWSWYEVTLFGPLPIHRWSIGEDNMTEYFPPYEKKGGRSVKITGDDLSMVKTLDQVPPVGWYSKAPLPIPDQEISLRGNHRLITWLEPGDTYGERNLQVRHLNTQARKFDETQTLTTNRNAIQNPSVEMINDHIGVCAWMQSRHTPESIQNTKDFDIIGAVAQSQDILFSVNDFTNDSIIFSGTVDDDMTSYYSGRAEGKPHVTVISDTRALITWLVANLDTGKSDVWYILLQNINGQWTASQPKTIAESGGTQAQIKVASPKENIAVAVWENVDYENPMKNRLYSAVFNGSQWSVPQQVLQDTTVHYNFFDIDFENNYGGMVFTTYSDDPSTSFNEALGVLPWNFQTNNWSTLPPEILYNDQNYHLETPCMTINTNGQTAIAFKKGQQGTILPDRRLSQVDVLYGSINNLSGSWKHIEADPFVCDTTKQVSNVELAFAGSDTLMILSHEYMMAATNVNYTPTNGRRFGNSQMNLILRAFRIDELGNVSDVNENHFFNLSVVPHPYKDVVLEQNYPNPCSDQTFIKFHLPDQEEVIIEIFNLQGRRVGRVLEQNLRPGSYELELDTGTLPQGSYVITMKTSHSIKSMKMIVQR